MALAILQLFASKIPEDWQKYIPQEMASLPIEPPTGINRIEEALGVFWLRANGHMRDKRRNYRHLHNALLIAGALGFRFTGWIQIAGSIALYTIAYFDKNYEPAGKGQLADRRANQNTVLLGELYLGILVVSGLGQTLLPGFCVITLYDPLKRHLLGSGNSK